MLVNQALRETLEKRFDFQDWRDAKRFPLHLFVLGFFLSGEEFAGWQPDNLDFIESNKEGRPPIAMATFTSVNGNPPASFSVKAYECSSRIEALDRLLEMLALIQLPGVERLERGQETGLGEVVFNSADHTCVLFVRANVLVVVQNAAREPADAIPFARLFDQYLTQRPLAPMDELTPLVMPVESPAPPPATGAVVPFNLSLTNRVSAPRVWFKFFSRTGRVREKGGQPFYAALDDAAEAHEVEVFAVAPGLGAGANTFSIRGA
jgi:hypothetical protein